MEKTFKLIASSENLTRFRSQLKILLDQSGLIEKKSGEVLLAIQEVLTNILKHGYRGKPSEVTITYTDEPDQITITVQDSGKKFDMTQHADPKLPPDKPGGLGIYLIKTSDRKSTRLNSSHSQISY